MNRSLVQKSVFSTQNTTVFMLFLMKYHLPISHRFIAILHDFRRFWPKNLRGGGCPPSEAQVGGVFSKFSTSGIPSIPPVQIYRN